jgi:hypothetical protein
VRPLDDSHFDFLAHRYGHLREFAPAFLQAFTFRSNLNPDPLLQAIELLRTLLPRHPSLRIEDESLVVGPLHAEDKPHSLVALRIAVRRAFREQTWLPRCSSRLSRKSIIAGASRSSTHNVNGCLPVFFFRNCNNSRNESR